MSKKKHADATSSGEVELTEKDLEKAQGGMFANTQMMGVGVKQKAADGDGNTVVKKPTDKASPP